MDWVKVWEVMLHYYKFRRELSGPVTAKDVYIKRSAGRVWPEECPPIRAANGFGFDIVANFDLTFIRTRSKSGRAWRVKNDIVIESDFDFASNEASTGQPLVQQYAWFWQKGQTLPHAISNNV